MISDIAAITTAVASVVLVIFLAVPLWKSEAVFAQSERPIEELSDEVVVVVKQGQDPSDQVNNQLERVDSTTSATSRSVGDVSALTTLVTVTLGKPFIKVVAFSYAVRKAIGLNQEGQEET